MQLNGELFGTKEKNQKVATDIVNTLTENYFQRSFEGLKSIGIWWIKLEGDYFEISEDNYLFCMYFLKITAFWELLDRTT